MRTGGPKKTGPLVLFLGKASGDSAGQFPPEPAGIGSRFPLSDAV